MDKNTIIHVVPHFHWDREWYMSFREFQLKLVAAMDRILELLEKGSNYKCFMLDGQTMVLRDYLEIRPEKREALIELIRCGRLEVGPWYIQSDEFLTSGEALVRNLLFGKKTLEELGIHDSMKVGYLPDQFGHISQMPQVLRKAGLDNAVFSRGVLLSPDEKSEFLWQSPDGSQVLAILQTGFYNSAENIPEDPAELNAYISHLSGYMGEKSHVPECQMFANGRDHYLPQENLTKVLSTANTAVGKVELIHSKLEDFVNEIRQAVGKVQLGVKAGELREGPVLGNTASSRLYLKQYNVKDQMLLENWLEPFSMLSRTKAKGADRKAFIDKAWSILLENHPHDSICGCSVDKVHETMMVRFGEVEDIASTLLQESLENIARHTDRSDCEHDAYITVFNPLGWERKENVTVSIDFPIEENVHDIRLFDSSGSEVACQILNIYDTKIIKKADRFIPFPFMVRRFEVVFCAKVPAVGYSTYFVRREGERSPYFLIPVKTSKPGSESDVPVGTNRMDTLENEYLKVQINANGSLDITDRKTGAVYPSLCIFEDMGDRGDEYYYMKPLRDRVVTTAHSKPVISLVNGGERFAEFCIEQRMEIPARLQLGREDRSHEIVVMTIRSFIGLSTGSRRLDIRGTVDNPAEDHRVRVLIPTGFASGFSSAHAPFDVIDRPVDLDGTQYTEPAFPQGHFVSLQDGGKGLTVANTGLAEFEVLKDRTLALTILRCVDRIGVSLEAGSVSMTPGAQCPGRNEFAFSIIPHAGNWEDSASYKDAYAFNLPMKAVCLPDGEKYMEKGDWKAPGCCLPVFKEIRVDGPKLEKVGGLLDIGPDGVLLSAVKPGEDGKSVVIRVFNIRGLAQEARLMLHFPFQEVKETDLYEVPLPQDSKLKVDGNTVVFEIGAREIKTFRIFVSGREQRVPS